MVKAVFLDMDNTLIETQQIYFDAEVRFADFMRGCGVQVPAQTLVDFLRARQIALFDHYGYGKELLPQAYEDTLAHYLPDATARERAQVRAIACTVYSTEAGVKPGAAAALESLARAGFDLYLMTVGDADVQKARIAALPFKRMFRDIFVVAEKDAAAYAAALAKAGLQGAQAAMIGDSLKSDILPARENGMEALYVPAANWHGRETAGQILPEGARAVPDIVAAAADLVARFGVAPDIRPRARKHGGFRP
jgi:putative hydrolase of the HAD superfamily